MRHIESDLQKACVAWFRLQHPDLAPLLFAVPNGGRRGKVTAAIMKGEGVLSGVADLMLLVPSGDFHALCVEMKTDTGRQSDSQKGWQAAVEARGYKYAVCRSLDQFMGTVTDYLAGRV